MRNVYHRFVSLLKMSPLQQCFLHNYFVNANQQLSFFISGTSTVKTQNVHKKLISILAKIIPNNTIIPGKYQVLPFTSKICKLAHLVANIFDLFYNILSLNSRSNPDVNALCNKHFREIYTAKLESKRGNKCNNMVFQRDSGCR